MLEVYSQWSNAEPYITAKPGYVGGLDALRVGAYTLYEQIYWTIDEAFKLVQRGSDENPIYIPTAKQIVETKHRYLANQMAVITDPSMGTEGVQAEAMAWITALFRRERFASRFSANKRFGIMRGDWIFRIAADPEREEGSRLSILPVDPGGFFLVYNEENVDEIIGVDLASMIEVEGREYLQKTSYRKETGKGGPSPITMTEGLYKVDKSGLPGMDEGEPERVTIPEVRFPDPIDQLPVYHIPNFDEPGTTWGSSEIRGMERLMGAVNQAISDEELALALEGLGVYFTDGGPPLDPDTHEPVPWDIGPGRVVEIAATKNFGRVQGIQSIEPMQGHLKYLHEQIDLTAAIPSVAKGRVDVQVAESGIALILEMGPMLARTAEGEQVVTDVLVNFLHDLKKWGAAYDGFTLVDDIVWLPTYGDKIPLNRQQRFKELLEMLNSTTPLVSATWVRGELKKLGYEFPSDADMLNQILEEKTAVEQIAADVYGSQVDAEAEAIEGNGQVDEDAFLG